MANKMYIICAHIKSITIPLEVYMDENNAVERLQLLRQTNTISDKAFSLQYAPLMDGNVKS